MIHIGKLTLLFLLISGMANGQNATSDAPIAKTSSSNHEPYTYVEQMPSFPGGEEKLFQFLADNLKYPPYARENNITGTVFLSFVVNEDGSITEVQVLRGISGGAVCDAEAKRVVQAMPPWKPGKQNGRAVPVRYNLPIKFKLN